MSRAFTTFVSDNYSVVFHPKGAAYTIANHASGEYVHLQGDDVIALDDEMEMILENSSSETEFVATHERLLSDYFDRN